MSERIFSMGIWLSVSNFEELIGYQKTLNMLDAFKFMKSEVTVVNHVLDRGAKIL